MRATHLNTAVFAFGRFNPPTIGHGRLVEVVKKQPGVPFLFLTHTQKPKTDPLTFEQKVKYAKASFTNIKIGDSSVRTLIQALQKLESLGFTNVIMVAGDDRVQQFTEFLPKYNGKDYSFESVKVVSAGERDPDSEGAVGMSASKMKAMAMAGDLKGFTKGTVNPDIAKSMYDDVRAGMEVTEMKEAQYPMPNVYVDMDGVLTEYYQRVAEWVNVSSGRPFDGDWYNMTPADEVSAIATAPSSWFQNLAKRAEANALIDLVMSKNNTWDVLSTGPTYNAQKTAWITTHFGTPGSGSGRAPASVNYATDYNKAPYGGANKLLIDDRTTYINQFEGAGGKGFKYFESGGIKDFGGGNMSVGPLTILA